MFDRFQQLEERYVELGEQMASPEFKTTAKPRTKPPKPTATSKPRSRSSANTSR